MPRRRVTAHQPHMRRARGNATKRGEAFCIRQPCSQFFQHCPLAHVHHRDIDSINALHTTHTLWKETSLSTESDTKILQSIYFAYKVGIISSYTTHGHGRRKKRSFDIRQRHSFLRFCCHCKFFSGKNQ